MKNTHTERQAIYDQLCRILTDYENPDSSGEPVTESDLYDMLVVIQENWEYPITAQD